LLRENFSSLLLLLFSRSFTLPFHLVLLSESKAQGKREANTASARERERESRDSFVFEEKKKLKS
jgi:hypothetical protein